MRGSGELIREERVPGGEFTERLRRRLVGRVGQGQGPYFGYCRGGPAMCRVLLGWSTATRGFDRDMYRTAGGQESRPASESCLYDGQARSAELALPLRLGAAASQAMELAESVEAGMARPGQA